MKKKSNKLQKAALAAGMSVIALCAAAATARYSAVEVQAASSRYQLVWSDEFNGTSLNTNNWNYNIGNSGTDGNNPGWGNNELQYYTDREENVKVSNGTLKLIARQENYEGYSYTSGRITTSGKQSFQYGKLEARMKLPATKGIWPAFWMMGYNEKGWPYCGEIDILESWNEYNFAQGAWHWFDDLRPQNETWTMYRYGQMNSSTKGFEGFDKTQWHVYGIEWDKKEIRWTVDDKVYWKVDITPKSMSEAHAEYYFLLNLAVGGNLPGTAPDAGTLPVQAEVDYVRAYQLTNSGSKYKNQWTEQNQVRKYTVKVADGQKTYVNQTVYDGETVAVPALTKRGYTFDGFYYTKNGKSYKLTSNTRIRNDITAKAKWTKVKVKRASISSIKAGKKMAKLKFKTTGGAKGYQIKYSTNKSVKGAKTISVKGKSIAVPKLTSGKKYYFKVRAYKLDSKKKKVYGIWSKVKSVTVK